jgi:N-ethylmaleimide reductase
MNFPTLFSPLKVGPYRLAHRVVMAPLTRMHTARPSLAPRPLNADYYAQRATSGGLIIAEASPVTATGFGNPGVPGIWSEQQVEGWRQVVDAVHAKGGIIFLQLWHVGRVSHPSARRRAASGAVGDRDLPRVQGHDRARQGRPVRDAARAQDR